jgi:2-polyprenyl-3-methyl-5-hydroxy-6-metoxy-1,4-benzoquinol methylase
MSDFDGRAATWDQNPLHTERTEVIACDMLKRMEWGPSMRGLEFGAGTGLLSFRLAPYFERVDAMDVSSEMVKVMHAKVQALHAPNVFPVCHDLVAAPFCPGKFDRIFSQMVLHHIADTKAILSRFYEELKPGGQLALVDLYTEDGSFHGPDFDGHLGFDTDRLSEWTLQAGFSGVRVFPTYVLRKPVGGEERTYPLFLLLADK